MFDTCSPRKDSKTVVLELPITFENGFGPFEETYSVLNQEPSSENLIGSPWVATYPSIKGIPDNWHHVVRYMEWLNARQFVYQNYHQGKIGPELYNSLLKSWNWVPDQTILSKKPINCFVYVITGQDSYGNNVMRIDCNNNLDFSDETTFYPKALSRFWKTKNDQFKSGYKKFHMVQYESVRFGKIVPDSIPMILRYAPEQVNEKLYWCSFPQYGVTTLSWKGRNYRIAISRNFNGSSFYDARIVALGESDDDKNLTFFQTIQIGGFLETGTLLSRSRFKYLGINQSENILLLESAEEIKKRILCSKFQIVHAYTKQHS
ncbi:hypothetical protein [Dyadobacter sp. NIV53]|uniref:hypothetical protein n=1 Tax=Dyadobacter sp. NIV53 TaxID=2861765 RepID=UPI001C874000|nr:hypothetical protein [Dyadobacter sp. NIV53]